MVTVYPRSALGPPNFLRPHSCGSLDKIRSPRHRDWHTHPERASTWGHGAVNINSSRRLEPKPRFAMVLALALTLLISACETLQVK